MGRVRGKRWGRRGRLGLMDSAFSLQIFSCLTKRANSITLLLTLFLFVWLDKNNASSYYSRLKLGDTQIEPLNHNFRMHKAQFKFDISFHAVLRTIFPASSTHSFFNNAVESRWRKRKKNEVVLHPRTNYYIVWYNYVLVVLINL